MRRRAAGGRPVRVAVRLADQLHRADPGGVGQRALQGQGRGEDDSRHGAAPRKAIFRSRSIRAVITRAASADSPASSGCNALKTWFSNTATGTPSRYAMRLRARAATHAPAVTMPARLRGSAVDTA